jgi:hypothetical protein
VPDPQRLFELSNAVTQAESAADPRTLMRERPQDYSLMMLARTSRLSSAGTVICRR